MTRRMLAIGLIILGIVVLAMGGISWTQDRTVVDIGPLQASVEERKTLPYSPVIGVMALIGGGVLLVAPSRRRT